MDIFEGVESQYIWLVRYEDSTNHVMYSIRGRQNMGILDDGQDREVEAHAKMESLF